MIVSRSVTASNLTCSETAKAVSFSFLGNAKPSLRYVQHRFEFLYREAIKKKGCREQCSLPGFGAEPQPSPPLSHKKCRVPDKRQSATLKHLELFGRNQIVIQRLSAILHFHIQIAEHLGDFLAQRVSILLLGILTIVNRDERIAVLNDMLDQL